MFGVGGISGLTIDGELWRCCRIHPAPKGAGILLEFYNGGDHVDTIHYDHVEDEFVKFKQANPGDDIAVINVHSDELLAAVQPSYWVKDVGQEYTQVSERALKQPHVVYRDLHIEYTGKLFDLPHDQRADFRWAQEHVTIVPKDDYSFG